MTKLAIVALLATLSLVSGTVDTLVDQPQPPHDQSNESESRELNQPAKHLNVLPQSPSFQESRFKDPSASLKPLPSLPPVKSFRDEDVVHCYSCQDCPLVLGNTTTKYCPLVFGSLKKSCVVFAEQYRPKLKKTHYIRGCASERGSCAEIQQSRTNGIVSLLFCEECEGDKCNTNAAFRSYTNFSIALLAMVFAPIVLKNII